MLLQIAKLPSMLLQTLTSTTLSWRAKALITFGVLSWCMQAAMAARVISKNNCMTINGVKTCVPDGEYQGSGFIGFSVGFGPGGAFMQTHGKLAPTASPAP